jgi:hypothetical protein
MGTLVLGDLAVLLDFVGTYGITRLMIVAAVLLGCWLGLKRAGFEGRARLATWLAVALPLTFWFVGVWWLALSGAFQPRPAVPALPLAIIAPVAVGLPLLMRSRRIAQMLDAIPPQWLVALQVYRVVGATFLVQWGLGNISTAFALPAGLGDMLVGLLAIPAALALRPGTRRALTRAVRWNLLGILDLVVAVTLGALSQNGFLPSSPLGYPLVMIPAFAVPLSLILHGLSLWQLKRRRVALQEVERSTGINAVAVAR